MDENESNQFLMTSSQYPKEAVRKRQNSAQNSIGSDSSRFSRKSFKLDYRLEEDVSKSKKGKDGRFVNPWPTWKSLSLPNVLRWLIMEKNHSSIPCSKEVMFGSIECCAFTLSLYNFIVNCIMTFELLN